MYYDAAEEAIFAIYMSHQAKFLEFVGYIKSDAVDFDDLVDSIREYISLLENSNTGAFDKNIYPTLNALTQYLSNAHSYAWHVLALLNLLRRKDKRNLYTYKPFIPDIEDMEYYSHDDSGDMRYTKTAIKRLKAKSYVNHTLLKVYQDKMAEPFSRSLSKLDSLGSRNTYNLATFNKLRNSIIHKQHDLVIAALTKEAAADLIEITNSVKDFVLNEIEKSSFKDAVESLSKTIFEDEPEILSHINDQSTDIAPIIAYIDMKRRKYRGD